VFEQPFGRILTERTAARAVDGDTVEVEPGEVGGFGNIETDRRKVGGKPTGELIAAHRDRALHRCHPVVALRPGCNRASDAQRACRALLMAGHRVEHGEQGCVVDVCDRGAEPGEVEGFARRTERDEAASESVVADRERAMSDAGMEQLTPDLVGDHEEVVSLRYVGHGGNFLSVEDTPGRIVRVAKQQDLGGRVDGRFEPIGVDPPTVGVERAVDATPPTVGDGIEERVVDRAEHDNAITRVGRVPQRDLEGVQRAGERPDAVLVGAPSVPTFLPIGVRRRELSGKGSVAEVTTIEVTTDRVDDRRRRVEVHVGDKRRDHIRPVLGPLDSDTRSGALLADRQQFTGLPHGRTVVRAVQLSTSVASHACHRPTTASTTAPTTAPTTARRYGSLVDRKLIALDLDGTLLGASGRVSARNVAAVQAAADAGHHVVIATGRPLHLVADLADDLGDAVSYIVGTNGSMVGTFPDAALVRLMGFDFDLAREAITRIRAALPGTGFALATDAGLAHEPGFAERMPTAIDVDPTEDVLTLGGAEAYKLFAFHDDMSVAALLEDVPAHLPAGLSASHMGADAIDIGLETIDKCSGLRWVCDELGVDATNVIAFGDEWNDLTMLEWAGRGVAMGNADARVQSIADEVAPANTADGVAVVLERLLG